MTHAPPTATRGLTDLGGLPTADGRVVARGRVLRADGGVVVCRTLIELAPAHEVTMPQSLDADVDVVRLPIELAPAGDAFDAASRYLAVAYGGARSIAGAFDVLASTRRLPVAVRCTARRERAAVLAILLLGALGVGDSHLASMHTLTARACSPEPLFSFLRRLRERHGGVDWYLADIGVARGTVDLLRDNLLDG